MVSGAGCRSGPVCRGVRSPPRDGQRVPATTSTIALPFAYTDEGASERRTRGEVQRTLRPEEL
jgi:hypothetical protein